MTTRSHPSRATRFRVLLVATVAAVAMLGAACSDSDSSGATSDSSKTTTTAAAAPEKAGTAKIATTDIPASVQCKGATSTQVPVGYTTEGAKKVQIYIDGALTPGDSPVNGSVTVAVHCDGLPHTFVVRALDADGNPTVVKSLVTTEQ